MRPRRWASVHKELKPKLYKMLFTGSPEVAKKSNGRNYIRLKNIRSVKQRGNETETAKEQPCDKFGTADCNKEAHVVPANKGVLDGGSTLQSNRTKTLINVNTKYTKTHKDNPSPECPKCLGEGCHMCWMAV